MLNKNNNIIKIGILKISEQNKAILEFYFDSVGKSYYKQASIEDADAFITDIDVPGSAEHLEELTTTTKKPAIILSIAEKTLPSSIWLAKPLSADALTKAAKGIHALLQTEEALETESEEDISEANDKVAVTQESVIEEKAEAVTTEPALIKEEVDTFALATADSEEDQIESSSDIMDFSDEVVEDEIKHVLEESQNTDQELSPDDKEVDDLLASLISGQGERKQVTEETSELDEIPLMAELPDTDNTAEIIDQKDNHLSKKEPNEEAMDLLNELSLENEIEEKDQTVTEHKELKEEPVEEQIDALTNLDGESSENDFLDYELEPSPQENNTKAITEDATTDISDVESKIEDEFSDIFADSNNPNALINENNHLDENVGFESLEAKIDSIDVEPESVVVEDTLEQSENNSLGEPTEENISSQSPEQELQSLLNEIRDEANISSGSSTVDNTATKKKKKRIFKPTNAEKRWDLLCGKNTSLSNKKDLKENSFKLNDHLLSIILDHIDQSKSSEEVLRIKHKDCIIVIDYSMDYIYSELSIYSDEYAELCYQPVNPEIVKIHELDNSEIRMYRKKLEDDPDTAHSIESFIWTTALLTSRGRLLENTDIKKKIGLKAWPNLTRLENIPHAMNIAAVFSKHPGSLDEVTKWLKVPQRYIFAFYNAAFFLNLVELDSSKFKKTNFTFDKQNSSSKEQTKERGFFSRLLKRITS